jgi:drug/metabolite transporter (DMT)-like permease
MIKRLGPFVNLVLSVIILNRPFNLNYGVIGIVMSAVGCMVGALGDNTSDFYLYGLTIGSVLLQSFYQTEVEKVAISENLNPFEILYVNAVNTLPVLILIFAATGEYIPVFNSDLWSERKWFLFVL